MAAFAVACCGSNGSLLFCCVCSIGPILPSGTVKSLPVLLAQALPTLWINAERLNTVHARETHERPVIGSGSIAKQAREQGKRVIGQRRIDERFLTIESLGCATTRETISVKVSLSRFGEEFRNSRERSVFEQRHEFNEHVSLPD